MSADRCEPPAESRSEEGWCWLVRPAMKSRWEAVVAFWDGEYWLIHSRAQAPEPAAALGWQYATRTPIPAEEYLLRGSVNLVTFVVDLRCKRDDVVEFLRTTLDFQTSGV